MQENQNFAGKASSYQKGRSSYPDQLKSVLHTLVFLIQLILGLLISGVEQEFFPVC